MAGIYDRPEMFADDGGDEPRLDLDAVGRLDLTPLAELSLPRDEYRPDPIGIEGVPVSYLIDPQPEAEAVATYGLSAGMLPRSNEHPVYVPTTEAQIAYAVACPDCEQPPGSVCVGMRDRKPKPATHAARYVAAAEAGFTVA